MFNRRNRKTPIGKKRRDDFFAATVLHPCRQNTGSIKLDEKILVILQLKGGNDGLNAVVPYEDDRYYLKRPNLAIPKESVLPLNSLLGLHPSMGAMKNMFEEGNLAILQNVGYEDQDRSHFRSTDIWLTASDADVYLHDGWIGRTLLREFSDAVAAFMNDMKKQGLADKVALMTISEFGRKAAELANGYYQRVTYAVDFNANAQGKKLASGVYIYRIEAGSFRKSIKMMLVK